MRPLNLSLMRAQYYNSWYNKLFAPSSDFMSIFQPKSYFLGIATGIVILLLVQGGMTLKNWSSSTASQASGSSTQRQRGQGAGFNLSTAATRLGMTQAELENELKAGKSLRDIATAHGVDFTQLRGSRTGTGALRNGSGSFLRGGSGAFLRTGTGSFMRRTGSGRTVGGSSSVPQSSSSPQQ